MNWTPDFSRQRARILALTEVPEITVPEEIEAALRQGSARPDRLWMDCFAAVKRILARAAGVSLLSSLCASGATLIGMEILALDHGLRGLAGLSFAFFGANALSALSAAYGSRLRTLAGLGVEAHLASAVARKTSRLSTRAAAGFSRGNLKILITSDVRSIGDFFDNFARNLLPAIAALLVATPLLYRFTGLAGLIGLAVMAAMIPFSAAVSAYSARFREKEQVRADALTSLIGEWVRNIRLIRFLSWQEPFRNEIARKVKELNRYSIIQHLFLCLLFGLSFSWWMIAVAAIPIAERALGVETDLIRLFGSIWLITLIHAYLQHVPNTVRLYAQAAVSMKRIRGLLEAEELESEFLPASGHPAPEAHPVAITLEAVVLDHSPGKRALDALSFRLSLDRRTAIIGEVGSGKTTLLKILCAECRPSSGRVVVEFSDGAALDLREQAAFKAWRSWIAYVPQEPFVSNDTLRSNLTLGDDARAPEQDVWRALELAELSADLSSFAKGIEEEIGEGGVNLSGGQRQRLNLARAFLSGRRYFILDDTLSAVDARTEAKLKDSLVSGPKGFCLVTHRLGELMRADRILVLREGRLVEDGVPAILAQDPGSSFVRILNAYRESEAKP